MASASRNDAEDRDGNGTDTDDDDPLRRAVFAAARTPLPPANRVRDGTTPDTDDLRFTAPPSQLNSFAGTPSVDPSATTSAAPSFAAFFSGTWPFDEAACSDNITNSTSGKFQLKQ